MDPGKLNKRVVLQKKIITQDAELNPVETWVTIATVWAEVLSQSGREYYRLATVNSEIETIFRIRYRVIDPQMRILLKCKAYEIIAAINPEEANKELLITCKAVV